MGKTLSVYTLVHLVHPITLAPHPHPPKKEEFLPSWLDLSP